MYNMNINLFILHELISKMIDSRSPNFILKIAWRYAREGAHPPPTPSPRRSLTPNFASVE